MKIVEEIFYENRWIFFLLGTAFIVEIFGFGIIPGSSAILPSTLVIVYFLGLSSIIRFVIVRRQLHKVVAGTIDLAMYLGYCVIKEVVFGVHLCRLSLLFILCTFAAFKILIYEQEKTK